MSICFLLFFIFTILSISNKYLFKQIKKKGAAAPVAGGAWPIIGHLHLLGGLQPAHITLNNMAAKYGPIFTIKLGVHQTLVVSNSKIAKECLTIHDKAFANRPNLIAMEVMGYNNAMFGLASYGSFSRAKCARLFPSSSWLESLKHVRESVVKESVQLLYRQWNESSKDSSFRVLVEMKRWFADVTLDLMMRIIIGKKIGCAKDDVFRGKWRKALGEFFKLMGKFVISDAFPVLRRFDFGGDEKMMKKTIKELDQVMEGWLLETKERRMSSSSSSSEVKKEEHFMDVMLSILNDIEDHDADTINKATCLGLILGGTDTITVTLTWALSLLLNNRDALKKVRDELAIHVGKNKTAVEESDLRNLVYLQAIIKESMRLYPAAPLLIPHMSFEDCNVSGYHVPARTRLLINVSGIQRDPNVWTNPNLNLNRRGF